MTRLASREDDDLTGGESAAQEIRDDPCDDSWLVRLVLICAHTNTQAREIARRFELHRHRAFDELKCTTEASRLLEPNGLRKAGLLNQLPQDVLPNLSFPRA